ncbi:MULTISPECIES: tetratricopeptide repeat protein [Cellvibrio]|jgi:tetratricopeptide (TPR) repeat protein|uniref:Tetratricopeptide (TPR) repeat protein n=1 Tax=Cellvibrio fibrivorans TaxID=126350 RepID=A0ABU1UZ63_9GAMM|nr:tetratricopeptide repeat protein [Cellvibrio fibrivorans]MDR7090484.1 tetratricopeptide (TPR) repeat protein [Cellvibrio fibrivorans]
MKNSTMRTFFKTITLLKVTTLKFIALAALSCLALTGYAEEAADIQKLQTRWAEIKYQTPEAEQEKAFASLVVEAEQLRAANTRAPYLIWEAIIRSTYAGAKGGLGALDQVKQAKKLLEQAIKMDPAAMNGSAYTSLGSLYYQVPGWPVGFGDHKKAKELLLKGLSYNPDGIDSNYFYGDYLLEQKDYKKAIAAFEKALKAAPRPGRESADAGRKGEIAAAMAKAKKHL